jgi:N-acetylmuramoyl-L-alanine amidase
MREREKPNRRYLILLKKIAVLSAFVLIAAISLAVVIDQNPVQANGPELNQGDTGGYVWDLQHRLQQLGLYQQHMDGYFGPITQQAVHQFQQNAGLTVDGTVGSETWNVLRENTLTEDEIEKMAKMVYGEARGESFEGQVAVAAVILNRLESPEFPDTIEGVLFEDLAFTAVADGQYYSTPDETAYRAVYKALEGWDPSGNALYYFNPETATSKWIWTREQIKKIDKHIFAK